jgi:hypothetical protein
LNYPDKAVPRTPDGKVNYTAPAPKQANGKPDLTGVWLGDQWNPAGKQQVAAGARPAQPEMLPWAQKVFADRRASNLKDDPEARCMPQGVPKAATLPYPFEIIHTPKKTVVLFEMYSLRRQIFTDGRDLPTDIQSPSWMGYSVGRWDGDEFVVTSSGFNDLVWNIDLAGHPHSEEMKIEERYRRKDWGHLEVQVTITDPKTYVKPWVMPLMRYTMLPDTDLLEFVCEKNIDVEHMVGK